MNIGHQTYEWTEEQTKLFRDYEDQWYNLCLDHGVSDERAVQVGNRYNEKREAGTVDPERVLNQYHLAIWREFEKKKKTHLTAPLEDPN